MLMRDSVKSDFEMRAWLLKWTHKTTHGNHIYAIGEYHMIKLKVDGYATKELTTYGFAVCPLDGSEPYHIIKDSSIRDGQVKHPVTFTEEELSGLIKNPHAK